MPRRISSNCRRLLAFAAWCVVLCASSGCLQAPPAVTLTCRVNADCPSGQCLAGICVDADAIISQDTLISGSDGAQAEVDQSTETVAADGLFSDVPAADAVTSTISCENDNDCKDMPGQACGQAFCDKLGNHCEINALPEDASCTSSVDSCPIAGQCHSGSCIALPGAHACDDQNGCTTDSCLAGQCQHGLLADGSTCPLLGPQADCFIGLCADNTATGGSTCVPLLKQGVCFIGGQCFGTGDVHSGSWCETCQPSIDSSTWTLAIQGACNDGDPCTVGETCDNKGSCTGSPLSCDDQSPCTTDSCDSKSGCVHGATDANTCDDGDSCTTVDNCVQGKCVGSAPLGCDDGNPCTQDSCKSGFGCQSEPLNGLGCIFDTDPCTTDVCLNGFCTGVPVNSSCTIAGKCVPALQKSADNPCLVCKPGIDPNGWTVLDAAPCDDGNACTSEDNCIIGVCVGSLTQCDDKNVCTKDNCTPAIGCVFTPTSALCDDNNACTLSDHCTLAKCVGTPMQPAQCDDGNPCTNDTCAPVVGCTHTPNLLACSDGNACTYKDFCNGGTCIGGAVVCPCNNDTMCDDGNPCTTDTCANNSGCSNLPAGITPCDDADACTKDDHCSAGVCGGTVVLCSDGNPCTDDACIAESGCAYLVKPDYGCNDGNACTAYDLCVAGQCVGTPQFCDDNNACTIDTCNAKTGKCEHLPELDGLACPADSLECSIDQCKAGQCDHNQIKAGTCLIDNTCLSGGVLQAGAPCMGCLPLQNPKGWSPRTGLACDTGNPCTINAVCINSAQCSGQQIPCDDGNPCTTDFCNGSAAKPCQHANAAGPCDDANPCTKNDLCTAGLCAGVTDTCDDGNACTTDSCAAQGGCVHALLANGSACLDDGIACTVDQCQAGGCTHAVDANACYLSTLKLCVKSGDLAPGKPCFACQPKVSSSDWSGSSGGSCDDGNACTSGDICQSGVCVGGGGSSPCDDNNPCTDDACLAPGGCVHTAVAGACSDGNACTIGDYCALGVCQPGTAKSCSGGNAAACTAPVCDPTVGCIVISTCGPLHACTAGLCLTSKGGVAGPVQVPLDSNIAPLPLLPSLAWQDSHLGPTGSIAQLMLAIQSQACTLSVNSSIIDLVFEPSQAQPTVEPLTVVPSQGCSQMPQLQQHPATYDHLVLSWLQANPASCAPGALASALVGVAGSGKSSVLTSPCPSGVPAPLLARPGIDLLIAAGANPDKVEDLSGVVLRPASQGDLQWQGSGTLGWGGAGKAIAHATIQAYVEMPLPTRPLVVAQSLGRALLSLGQFTKPGDTFSALELLKIAPDGNLDASAKVIMTGAETPGNSATYAGVDAAWDPEAGKLGVLISGTYVELGVTKGFIAFGRGSADAASPLANPAVVALFEPPAGYVGPAVIQAFRIAEIPGSPDFLLAWAMPGSASLQFMRLQPVDDKQFVVKKISLLASDFAGHSTGSFIKDGGGLSELVLAADGKRFSLAWESNGGLALITAALP